MRRVGTRTTASTLILGKPGCASHTAGQYLAKTGDRAFDHFRRILDLFSQLPRIKLDLGNSHQQYLQKNPNGYCGIGGTGGSCPIGVL